MYKKLVAGIIGLFLVPVIAFAAPSLADLRAQISSLLQIVLQLQSQLMELNQFGTLGDDDDGEDEIEVEDEDDEEEGDDDEVEDAEGLSVAWSEDSVESSSDYVPFTFDFGSIEPARYRVRIQCDSEVQSVLKVYGERCGEWVKLSWDKNTSAGSRYMWSAQLTNNTDEAGEAEVEVKLYNSRGLKIADAEDTIRVLPGIQEKLRVWWHDDVVESGDEYQLYSFDFGDYEPASYRLSLECDTDEIDANWKAYGGGCGEVVELKWNPYLQKEYKQSVQLKNMTDENQEVEIEVTLYDSSGDEIAEESDTVVVLPE